MLKMKAKDPCDNISGAMDTLKEASCDAAEKAGRTLRAMVDAASEDVHDVTEVTLKQIRTNPVRSSLVAAAIGFVLGALMQRR